MDERFGPAQPVAILQYSAPLTDLTSQQPDVSWEPWDLIPGIAKPRCTQSRVAKPVQMVGGRKYSVAETGRLR